MRRRSGKWAASAGKPAAAPAASAAAASAGRRSGEQWNAGGSVVELDSAGTQFGGEGGGGRVLDGVPAQGAGGGDVAGDVVDVEYLVRGDARPLSSDLVDPRLGLHAADLVAQDQRLESVR